MAESYKPRRVVPTVVAQVIVQRATRKSEISPDAHEVAIREVSELGLRRIGNSGLQGGRFVDEEAVADMLSDGLHQ